jgi:uncharacterized iron-regulated membrane protein
LKPSIEAPPPGVRTVSTPTVAPDARPQSAPEPAEAARPGASLYRVFWRWHFYAGILVAPVLLVVAITGALYIFRAEVEDWAHAGLRFVEPDGSRAGAQAQVQAAAAAFPGLTPARIEQPVAPDRASMVALEAEGGKAVATAYVDPYRLLVLGSEDPGDLGPLARFFDVTLEIHRTLFAGSFGRIVVELAIGWTIILLVTGTYLWWPRRSGHNPGTWWPRLKAKPYTILRDLHNVLGFYLLAPMLVIVATGLFYTLVWSEAFHFVTSDRSKAPEQAALEGSASPAAGWAAKVTLNEAEAAQRERYPDRSISIDLKPNGDGGIRGGAANDYNNSYGPYVSAQLVLDPDDGRVRSQKTLAEDERYWWHGWTYPLHVGSVYGLATKVLWLVACLVLAALPVTGLWMWWIRRPAGRTGFPRRPERRLPPVAARLHRLLGHPAPRRGPEHRRHHPRRGGCAVRLPAARAVVGRLRGRDVAPRLGR